MGVQLATKWGILTEEIITGQIFIQDCAENVKILFLLIRMWCLQYKI